MTIADHITRSLSQCGFLVSTYTSGRGVAIEAVYERCGCRWFVFASADEPDVANRCAVALVDSIGDVMGLDVGAG